jgi:PKD-like domain/Secretion system C-terminal sorting domain
VYGNSICGNGPVSAAYTVTVTQIPAAAGSVSGDNAVCAGSIAVPYSVAPIASATGYNWTLPTGATISSGNNTPNIMVDFAVGALSGNITVSGVNSCGTGTVSPSYAVTVYPMPDAPQITNHGDTLYSSIANNNQWFYEGAPVTTGTGQTFVAHYTGTYWDEIVTNGCESDTSNHIYITVTGVNDPSESNFVVYPVPNDGQFKLIMNAPAAATYDISISNNIGVNVYSRQNVTVNGKSEFKIDLRPVAAGVYTMVIRNGENKVVRKIIVNR